MLNRSVIVFSILFLSCCITKISAQNLFGVKPTAEYAEFLLFKNDFDKAASEYERLLFLDSSNISFYKNQLVQCYYHLNNLPAIYSLNIDQYGNKESKLIFKSFLNNEKYSSASHVLDSSSYTFSQEEKKFNSLMLQLFQQDFQNAVQITNSEFTEADIKEHIRVIGPITKELIDYKAKSPALAAAMSTIIPSAGRLYTKDYADAAVNFIFISVTAIQAYRGFTNPDIGEWQGWLYGSLSASFYLGNIFGSWQAAKRYNKQYYDKKLYEARTYYFNYY